MKIVYQHYRFSKYPQPCDDEFVGRHGAAYRYQRGHEVCDQVPNGPVKVRKTRWQPLPRGGYTLCMVYDDNRELVATGVAECSPKDSFCYKVGREIAHGRMLQQLFERCDGGRLAHEVFVGLGWTKAKTPDEFEQEQKALFERFAWKYDYFVKGGVQIPMEWMDED